MRQTELPKGTDDHLGLSIAGGILNREPHLLQCDVPMLVLAENLPIRLLQRTEQAPLADGLVVVTRTIVMAIPHGGVFQKRVRFLQDAEIFFRDCLIARFDRHLLTHPTTDDHDCEDGNCHKNQAPLHIVVL
jgi:hypothetical protein